jgi:CRISPR-associated protein Cas1
MIKRTIYLGNEAFLSTKDAQMLIRFPDKEKEPTKVPIEDIGVLVLDHYRITITQTLVSRLLDNNAALITCDARHMPQGLLLNLEGNTLQQERFADQINANVPLKKNLWQQTVKQKILNQAALLRQLKIPTENMEYWAASVGSGDPDNYEGRAAAYYWQRVFVEKVENFKRGRYEPEPNNLLNYGYAILRAITARSLVGSGLLPTLGIHHHNKYNAYALADDLMEPYRPFVDAVVLEILEKFDVEEELLPEHKKELLQIPVLDVLLSGQSSPLMIAMQQTTASLAECFAGDSRKIKYPVF